MSPSAFYSVMQKLINTNYFKLTFVLIKMAKKEGPDLTPMIAELSGRIRDIEEKHQLLKDKLRLVAQTLVEEKELRFQESEELKHDVLKIKKENERLKEYVRGISDYIEGLARKEDLMILQRQFDIFKPHIN